MTNILPNWSDSRKKLWVYRIMGIVGIVSGWVAYTVMWVVRVDNMALDFVIIYIFLAHFVYLTTYRQLGVVLFVQIAILLLVLNTVILIGLYSNRFDYFHSTSGTTTNAETSYTVFGGNAFMSGCWPIVVYRENKKRVNITINSIS